MFSAIDLCTMTGSSKDGYYNVEYSVPLKQCICVHAGVFKGSSVSGGVSSASWPEVMYLSRDAGWLARVHIKCSFCKSASCMALEEEHALGGLLTLQGTKINNFPQTLGVFCYESVPEGGCIWVGTADAGLLAAIARLRT